ncbi:MAG TPA: phage tail protein [Candidatus Limnocylindrales bacterium]
MPAGLPSLPMDAIASYHFSVEIDGVELAQFSELSGITSEIDVIDLKENTAQGKPIIKKLPGARKPPTITLKRAKNSSTALWDWHYAMYEGKVADARKNGSVVLYDYTFGEVSRYNFVNGWVSKVTMGSAKAGSNEVLMEEVSIVCEELKRVK